MLHLSKLKKNKKRKLLHAVQFLNLSVFAYDDRCHGRTAEKSQFIRLHLSSAPFPKCDRSQTTLGNRCLSKFFGTKSPGLPSSFFTRRLGKQAPSQQNIIACEQSCPPSSCTERRADICSNFNPALSSPSTTKRSKKWNKARVFCERVTAFKDHALE